MKWNSNKNAQADGGDGQVRKPGPLEKSAAAGIQRK